ncbi:amino acid ABC transporter permease [Pollutimonas bauzanensis]|uniref:Amino acid ABC transporter membrane protein 1, PAAT family (TC 3.A.1.3.-) n=1 Tax=Pollutimonas bauzanensis TaxID=658167 RepID=A0A1M5ZK35_9BURK|nr:amino acid ABC transporter permease [Pollutimonas bauzanensis]SHI24491.1 amino acid ABC transporter membrane protein 1, PAAT family (TC 3.A.1.3.-) [Pollutimonas bauzanensis]
MNYTLDFASLLSNGYPGLILRGVATTLEMTALAWLIAFALGSLLTVLRTLQIRVLDYLIVLYIAFHRNVPMLVHILLWYFGIAAIVPAFINDRINFLGGEFFYSTIAIGLVTAAYVSEDLRSAIRSIPHGQMEASRTLGLSYLRSMRKVILPQAFIISIPTLTNQTLLLFKNTSLAMAIGLIELTGAGREIESATFKTFEVYLVVTVIYLSISLVLMFVGAYLSKRSAFRAR